MKLKLFFLANILLASISVSAQETPEPAGKIMEDAYKLAAKENKLIMVIFHASYCGWCRKLDASITDPSCKEYFDRTFIIRHMTVLESKDKKNLENPGANDFFAKYAGNPEGVPYFLIFDKNKKLIADSKIRAEGDGLDKPGENMGCPASDEEVTTFVKLLRKISEITDNEATTITERFKKNKQK
jgi:thiol-disulfide isomerase/thioredoxin